MCLEVLNNVYLTRASCTVPQKHVAVASSSLDQPSCTRLFKGMYGLVLSAVDAIIVEFFFTAPIPDVVKSLKYYFA